MQDPHSQWDIIDADVLRLTVEASFNTYKERYCKKMHVL